MLITFIIYLGLLSSLSEALKYLYNKFRANENISNTNTSLYGGINESHFESESVSERHTESEILTRTRRKRNEKSNNYEDDNDQGKTKKEGRFEIDFLKIKILDI